MTQISKEKKREYNKAYREKKKQELLHETNPINEVTITEEPPKLSPPKKTQSKPKPKPESSDDEEEIDIDEYIETIVQQRLNETKKKTMKKKPKTDTDGIQWTRMIRDIVTGTAITMSPIALKTLFSYYQTSRNSAPIGLRERLAQQSATSSLRPNTALNQTLPTTNTQTSENTQNTSLAFVY